jgi:hypothetical protein
MSRPHFVRGVLLVFLAAIASCERAQVVVGQDGRMWCILPTPPELVNKMLDMAGVTPQDYVIDLDRATAALSSRPRSGEHARSGSNTTVRWSSSRGARLKASA